MVLMFPQCDFKCDRECGVQVCQNSALATTPDIDVDIGKLAYRYHNNQIAEAIVCQGLEPFDSWDDLYNFVFLFRHLVTEDDIVIYTGYNKDEIQDKVDILQNFKNIIIKFGRYIPGQQPHYDEVLGVNLASNNQYGEKVS